MTRFKSRVLNRIKRNFSKECEHTVIVNESDFGAGKRRFYENLKKQKEIYKNRKLFNKNNKKMAELKNYFNFLKVASGGKIDILQEILDEDSSKDYLIRDEDDNY